jgi:flagellar motor switch protein FliN/FliY
MAGEMLSQEEINALLGGMDLEDTSSSDGDSRLTPEQIDALGEIGNISMGTAATTLFALLNHKVMITTPKVELLALDDFKAQITDDLVAVSVDYTEGLTGMNLLILNEQDVKIIADLMMGGEGNPSDEPISELHLSAIAEAMNQMIGSSSTSMSQVFEKKIDISPPQAIQVSTAKEQVEAGLGFTEDVVKIAFRMQIEENIIDSQLIQVLPINFAKEMANELLQPKEVKVVSPAPEQQQAPAQQQVVQQQQVPIQQQVPQQQQAPIQQNYNMPQARTSTQVVRDVDLQTPQFQNFDKEMMTYPKENMNVLMDVSLEVSVELGRTQKRIKEILEFGPGSVIELDRLVGEPVDVLVNGKFIAKGEVVVIDENFGIRITDIINPENRI